MADDLLVSETIDLLWLVEHTVVGFKLRGPFKFFFDIINVRMTFFDVKGPVKWACDKIQGFFHIFYPYSAQNK